MGRKSKRSWRRRVSAWTRPARHAAAAALMRTLMAACGSLSHAGALRLARALGSLAGSIPNPERAKALRNLEIAFGAEKSAAERREIARETFASAAMTAVEAIHSAGWSDEKFRRAVEVHGEENWRAAMAPGKGAVMLTAHLGDWELIPPAFLFHSGIAMGVVMRRPRNPMLADWVVRMRSSRGIPVYTEDAPPLAFLRALKKGGALGVLADQDTKRLRGIFVDFFGRPAMTPVGPAFLARKTGAAFLPGFITRRADDPTRHDLRIHPPIWPDPSLDGEADARRMLELYTKILEGEIRAAPGQWVWMHERWKRQPKPPAE